MRNTTPVIGAWFETNDGTKLEVVAFDDDEGTVEVQFFDGTIEEYDFDTWNSLSLTSAHPPEDWSGSLDLDKVDGGLDRDQPAGEIHLSPLDDIYFDE